MECASVHTEIGLASARRRGTRPIRLMASCALVAFMVIALLGAHVALRAEIVAASARKAAAQARLEQAMKAYDRACLELARATSLDRIEEIARMRLGMVEPDAMALVLVDGIARPAVAASPAPSAAGAAADAGRAEQPPAVLAGLAGVAQQLVAAAVSNLVAAWFASPPPQIPSVLR